MINFMTGIWILQPLSSGNPDKNHAMVLGTTDHKFSFPVEDSLDLLGVTIDNHLNFTKHVSLVYKKVNNQLNVMIKFHNLICTATKLKLYNAFILPHFLYCSLAWHFCSTRNCDKLEPLNKRTLRIVFNDKVSSYQQLLCKSDGATMYNRRTQNMSITIYKCLKYDRFPKYF